MRNFHRRKKEPRPIHELERCGSVVICSTCGKLSETTIAEVNGRPKQEYCPNHIRALLRGEEQVQKPKPKYGNKPKTVMIDGVKRSHQSTLEADRHVYLSALQRAGEIENLRIQVPFRLDVNGVHICKYYADFTYNLPGQEALIVEDTKGMVTDVFKLKMRLMKACHGIDIVLTRAKDKRSRQVKR